ncbi:MAG: sugar phosphate isomerase/epimerase family protein [Stellaceae bacterium]
MTALVSVERLAINQITTKPWALDNAIRGYARHGVHAVAVWRDKLAELGQPAARRMLGDYGMRVVALTPVRVPVATDGDVQSAMDEILRAFDEATEIGAESLLMLAGPPMTMSPEKMKGVLAERLYALKQRAPSSLQLVIEPLHPIYAATVSPLNTLRDALDLCDQVEGLGVAVDVYNLSWDWDLERQIERAAGRLKGFHVSDWLRETTGDIRYDRGMMGDGCIDIRRIREWMDRAGYRDTIEVEIFSQNNWWRRDPDEVVRTCIERFHIYC